MSSDLVAFSSQDVVEIYRAKFLVPANWISCAVVVHVAGGHSVDGGEPVALAITRMSLSLCGQTGPLVSVPLESIRAVQVVDLTGIAYLVQTPSGPVDAVPRRAKGVAIKYELNPMGTQIELTLYTLAAKSAFEWVNVIQQAIYDASSDLGNVGKIIRR